MYSALTLCFNSLISDPVSIVSSPSQLSDRPLRHEFTVLIPAQNEEASIGSKVLLAASYADRVLVLDKGSTDRTMEVAALGGARVIPLAGGEEALLKVLYRASLDSELVVLIYPECMQDIDLLSHVLEPLRQGFDLSVGSWPCRVSCEQEAVMLLNGKSTFKEAPVKQDSQVQKGKKKGIVTIEQAVVRKTCSVVQHIAQVAVETGNKPVDYGDSQHGITIRKKRGISFKG